MRDYVNKHLRPQINSYMAHKRIELQQIFEDETFAYSSIPGKATERDGLKNCFITGEVIQKGACGMLDCGVAPNVTLIMEEGALAVNCMFGVATTRKITIHLGKNAMIQNSLVVIDTDLGDDSIVYQSQLGDPDINNDNTAYSFKCGRGSLLYCAAVMPTEMEGTEEAVSMELGNKFVVLLAVLKSVDSKLRAGDEFILCDYATALQLSFNGISSVEKPVTRSVLVCVNRSGGSVREMREQHPVATFYLDTEVGNRCYIGCEAAFDQRMLKKPRPTATLGDDVIIVSRAEARHEQSYNSSTCDIILCADKLDVADGVTLVGHGNCVWPAPYFTRLTVKEGAVLDYLSNGDVPLPESVTIAAHTAALL